LGLIGHSRPAVRPKFRLRLRRSRAARDSRANSNNMGYRVIIGVFVGAVPEIGSRRERKVRLSHRPQCDCGTLNLLLLALRLNCRRTARDAHAAVAANANAANWRRSD